MHPKSKIFFEFPRAIPNDLEGFTHFYPNKFPAILPEFKKHAKTYFMKPKEFKKFIYEQQKELFKGFYKIKADYEKEKNKTHEFMVKTDERLHKLFCFRFWVVNYGFCDGPIHDYYADKIREYSERIAEWEDVDDKEAATLEVERALMQGTYADLYLQSAFHSIKIYDFLTKNLKFKKFSQELEKYVLADELAKCYKLIDGLVNDLEKNPNTKTNKELMSFLQIARGVSKLRGDRLGYYNTIIYAFEFYEKNLELKIRHNMLKNRIKQILEKAKKTLNEEEHKELKVCYEMGDLFKEAKDVYGEIDGKLIPFWFGMLQQLAKEVGIKNTDAAFGIGHAAMFYRIVWYLPNELKAKVFTPDPTGFSLSRL